MELFTLVLLFLFLLQYVDQCSASDSFPVLTLRSVADADSPLQCLFNPVSFKEKIKPLFNE